MDPLKSPSWTSRLLHVTLGTFLWILFSPLLLLIFVPFLLLRLLHNLLATLLRPDLTPIWGAEDAILGLVPTSAHLNMNTAQIWRLDGALDVAAFRSHFRSCFLSTPDLRKKYANIRSRIVPWGCYTFKKTLSDIDLNKLIKELPPAQLNSDLDPDTTLDQLAPFIADWMATNDYAEDGPAWGALILPISPSSSLLLLKMDHALTDGYTFAHLASVLAGTRPPYLVKDHSHLTLSKRVEIFLSFPKLTIGQLIGYSRAGPLPYPDPAGDGETEPRWMMSFTRLELERVKMVRRMGGTHFNTVLGSVVIGALREHCSLHAEQDSKVKGQGKCQGIQLPARAWLPSPVGWPNHPAMCGGGMVNHMSLRNQSFPFAERDPVTRLQSGERSVEAAEAFGQAIGFHWIVASLAWMIPSPLFHGFLSLTGSGELMTGGMGQVLTPLLLSPEPHRLMGIDVLELHLPVHVPHLMTPTRLYVVPASVGGRLEVSVSGRSDAFPDQGSLDRFTKVLIPQELDALYEALIKRQEIKGVSSN